MRLTSFKSLVPAITSPLTLACLLFALLLSTLASLRISAAFNLQAQLDSMQFDVTEWISEPESTFEAGAAPWTTGSETTDARVNTEETRLPLILEAAMAASSPEKASAFIRLPEGKTAYFRPGDTVIDDISLIEVHSDHVLLDDNGRQQRLSFPDPQQAQTAPPPRGETSGRSAYTPQPTTGAAESGELSESEAPSRDYESAQQEAVRRRLMQIRDQSRGGNSSE